MNAQLGIASSSRFTVPSCTVTMSSQVYAPLIAE